MKRIYFIGECMLELKAKDESTMAQSFAGDVYNSAVYLKRAFPQILSGMVTVIGQNTISHRMSQRFLQEQLNTDFVFEHETKSPGVYLIETDAQGERTFTFWRNDSAARQLMQFFDDGMVNQLSTADMVFFSGVALAVIVPESRELFWQRITQLKQAGVTVVFDPNFRASLWPDKKLAKQQFEQAILLADWVLPGVEDFTALYGIESAQQVMDFCTTRGAQEVVVKNGPASVLTYSNGTKTEHSITPVTKVVDTTSAGDAFNGGYLGARLSGLTLEQAVKIGAVAAGTVIQYPGAIIPKAIFDQAMASLTV
ncbi:sugar kinase [Neptunicella marina]|uniref:Sugar kinase n=1 Tax=Neptunicella marina TaxID=2125989 RepID=A0A8J6IUE2_9ALTE|nr:sugar kinase [Neptunicella marina]MBC3765806.1 sugar kinase [Neptunicella marina]